MSSILSKAVRGFAGAAVGIADDALAELRSRRLQEFQFNLGAGEREQARQDNLNQQNRQYDLQKQGQDHQIANSDKSLAMQQENMRADNASRSAQLSISQQGLDLQKDNSEFGKAKFTYDQAMSGVDLAAKQLDEAIHLKPPIDPTTGQPINDPSFGESRGKLIEERTAQLNRAKIQAAKLHDQISSNPKFEKYADYFPSVYRSQQQDQPPADTSFNMINSPSPLLNRAR